MDIHSQLGHILHQDHHQEVDLLAVQQGMSLHQQQSLIHTDQHHQVDQSQAVRSRLEEVTFQLHSLNNSDHFQRRFHFSSSWRISEKNQEPFLYITADSHQPEAPHLGLLTFVPTFHLIAVGAVTDGVADVVFRLVSFNGSVSEQLDEKFSEIRNDLSNSRLLSDFAEKRFTMCYGLAKLPKRTQILLLKRSNFLRERFEDKIVWRSPKCQYAIEKSVDGIALNCCDECRTILEISPNCDLSGNSIKKEPLDANDDKAIDFSDLEDFFDDKPRLSIKERLDKLKLRGISVKKPGDLTSKNAPSKGSAVDFDDVEPLDDIVNDDDEDDGAEDGKLPHMMVTVTMKEGDETKVVPLDKIRQMRVSENRRKAPPAAIAAVPEKRKLKPVKRKAALASKENLTPEEKKLKRDAQEQLDKQAAERINSHVKKCPICQEPFGDVNLFMTHLSKCNVSSEEEEEEEEIKDGADEMEIDENGMAVKKTPASLKKKKKKKKRSFPLTALSCGICGQTFKFETHYEPHVKAHEEKLDLDVEVVCPLCNETLATKRHLNPHFKKNHPNDGGCCVECLQVMDVSLLKQHLAKQHQQTGAAPGQKDSIKGEGHLCPDCGKKCQYLSELEIHMAIQHMGIALERPSAKEEEVMCHECGKVFNHRYRLKQHLSTTHNKSRDHPCPFCAKVFCLKHQLTKHLLTHSDVKPFKCKYCDYQNVRKYRVQKHCQKAHNVAGTDQDIDVIEGGAKPSEFVQNFLNISTGKSHAPKPEPSAEMGDNLPDRMMY